MQQRTDGGRESEPEPGSRTPDAAPVTVHGDASAANGSASLPPAPLDPERPAAASSAAVPGPPSPPTSPTAQPSDVEDRMLFFAKIARSASEQEIQALFAQYGTVQEVNLFRAFQGAPTTKGCGLVTMGTREEARRALDALDNQFVFEGLEAPMVVKWMDAPLQRKRREVHLAALRQGHMPPTRSRGTMQLHYAHFSHADHPAWLAAPGPGSGSLLPPYARTGGGLTPEPSPSSSAFAGLPAPHTSLGFGPGTSFNLASPGMGFGGLPAAPPPLWSAPARFPSVHMPSPPLGLPGQSSVLEPEDDSPPSGCDPDAIKLFVGNVPKSCNELALLPLFEDIGQVVELTVIRDRATQAHKGSAFVWYATRALAERAILHFNMRHVVPDPTSSEAPRPLVVRRAHARAPAAPALPQRPPPFAASSPHLLWEQLQQQQQQQQFSAFYPGAYGAMMGHGGSSMLGLEALAVQQQQQQQAWPGIGGGGISGAPGSLLGYAGLQPGGAAEGAQSLHPLVSNLQGMPHGSVAAAYDMYQRALPMGSLDTAYLFPGPGGGGAAAAAAANPPFGARATVSLAVTPTQLAFINRAAASVEQVSGARLSVAPTGPSGPGLFHVVVSGSQAEVDSASSLLGSVIASATLQ